MKDFVSEAIKKVELIQPTRSFEEFRELFQEPFFIHCDFCDPFEKGFIPGTQFPSLSECARLYLNEKLLEGIQKGRLYPEIGYIPGC